MQICLILGFLVSLSYGEGYRIAPGDGLLIAVISQSEYNQTVKVMEDGKISYFGGDLPVAGKTPEEVDALIYAHIVGLGHLKDPTIMVSPLPGPKEIFVGGAVKLPNRYPLSREDDIGLYYAITVAGGVTEFADLTHVRVFRADERTVENYDLSSNSYDNVVAKDGDLVYVPAFGQVLVQGQVQGPRAVLIRDRIRIDHALAQAGGFDNQAAWNSVIIMKASGQKLTVEIPERFWEDFEVENDIYYLQDGDVLYVPNAFEREPVYILGYVHTPGPIRIREPTSPMQLIALAGGFNEQADRGKVIIQRKNGTTQKIDLNDPNNQKLHESAVLLYPGDTLDIRRRFQINWSLVLSFISVASVVASIAARN